MLLLWQQATDSSVCGVALLGALFLRYGFCLTEMVDVFYYDSRLPIVLFAG